MATDFQNVINKAEPGDTIVLESGATFAGITLPVHPGYGYVTVTSDAAMPGPTTRVTPADAVDFAKIEPAVGGAPGLATAAMAQGWRFIGVEFLPTPSRAGDIIALGDGSSAQNSLSLVPQNIILDRCYIHGDPTSGQKRGVSLNCGTASIINSYISDIFLPGQDTQAIAGWNGPGPWTLTNNYLEAAGENILIGGATIWIPNLIPTGITVSGSTITKPLAWRGRGYTVKNLIELKTGRNVTFDSNLISNCWGGEGQAGYAIVVTVRNEEGANPWATIQNAQFTRNTVAHVGGVFNILGLDDRGSAYASVMLTKFLSQDNVIYDVDGSTYTGSGALALIQRGDQINFDHTTYVRAGNAVTFYFNNQPCSNFSTTNNLVVGTSACVQTASDTVALNGLQGTAALNAFASPWTFTRNGIIGGTSSGYPAGNLYPASIAAVGFANPDANDYRLTVSSPYHNAATDGTDLGARFGTAPDPPDPPPPPPTPDPPSTPANPVPANGATNVATSQQLAWNLSANASTYTVAFGTVNPPPTVVASQAGTSYNPGTLSTSTVYYWKITASGLGGDTAGSVWSFTTAAPPAVPGTPSTPNPANGATNVPLSQVLTWNPTAFTSTYAVAFGTSNPPPTVVTSQTGTTYAPTLAYSTTYRWKITSTGTGGSTAGSVWTFTTVDAPPPPTPVPPGTPTNVSPVDTATDVPISVSLSWTSTNASTYDVQFGTANPPPTVSTGQTSAAYSPNALAYSTTYYAKVTAHNSDGTTAGSVWSFTTVAEPTPEPVTAPGAPADPTPADSATNVCPHATLSWSADNATSYDVALGTSNPPSVVSAGQTSSAYTPSTPLAWSTTYYLQVTAINAGGRTDGPVWSFTTAAVPSGIIVGGTVGTLLPNVKPQFGDANGDPVAGGFLYFYVAGSSTLLATFADVDLTIPNTNPIVLNSAGQSATSIFLQPTGYKVVLQDANGVQLWSVDDVEAINAEP